LAAVAIAMLAVAPGAPADEQVQGQPVDRYAGDVTMDQGEALTFMNADVNNHDVTADTAGSDGKPLFASATIGSGQTVPVNGAEYLTTGSYKFHCSIHPFMTATLTVTSNGTPKPRPGSGSGSGTGSGGGSGGGAGDTTAPTVRLSLGKLKLSSLRKTHKLPVKVTVSEAAVLNLAAAIGKRTIAGGKSTFTGAGSKTLRLSLNKAGRRAVARKRSIKLDLRAVADDPSGNKGVASASAKLRG
jgi:plastocyanin